MMGNRNMQCPHLSGFAGVAQLAEQLICNQQVAGSSPFTSSIILYHLVGFPSGQREQTVNLLSVTSVVRIHPLPPRKAPNCRCFFLIGESGGFTASLMQLQYFVLHEPSSRWWREVLYAQVPHFAITRMPPPLQEKHRIIGAFFL